MIHFRFYWPSCGARLRCALQLGAEYTHTLHLTTNKQRQTRRANEANSYNNLVLLQRTKSAILLNGNCQGGRGEETVIEEWKVENGNGKSDCQRLAGSAGTLALSQPQQQTAALMRLHMYCVCACESVCVCGACCDDYINLCIQVCHCVCVCSFVAQRKYHMVTKQLPQGTSCSACWAYTQ